MVVLVAATDTVYDGHTFWLSPVFEQNPAPGWPRGTGEPLEFKAGNYIGIFSIAVSRHNARVKDIIASSHDD